MIRHSTRLSLATVIATGVIAGVSGTHTVRADSIDPSSAQSKNIVETAQAAGEFNTLIAAVDAAGLVPLLTGEKPLTVFAPTDDAFAQVPEATLEALFEPVNRDVLISILAYHVVEGGVLAMEARTLDQAETLNTQAITISRAGDSLSINGDTNVINTDILASNGVIHVIDRVLIPEGALDRISMINEPPTLQNIIELAVERGAPIFNDGQPGACAAIYEVTIASLLATSRDAFTSNAATMMQDALREVRANQRHADARRNAWTLRRALDRAYLDLSNNESESSQQHMMSASRNDSSGNITPWSEAVSTLDPNTQTLERVEYVREAELPEGFPGPGPVGEIRIKRYPVYRAAVANQSARSEGSTFMRLFFHIQTNDIAMTAPVEQIIDDNGNMRSMAFLYADPDMGSTGETRNGVEVIDYPEQTVVSIGVRGDSNRGQIDAQIALLRTFVEANSNRIEITGDPRVLGYNSPMIPERKRFWEVQLPVRLIGEATEQFASTRN